MHKTLGLMVHPCQPPIDWPSAHRNGLHFAACSATQGEAYVDPMFEKHATGAARAGLVAGSFHVYQTDRDPIRQALRYHSMAGVVGVEMPPILDFRTLHGSSTPAEALWGALEFAEATEDLWEQRCIFSTSPAFWRLLGNTTAAAFAERHLWITRRGPEEPKAPAPWSHWFFWQFDTDGKRPEARDPRTDLVLFNGRPIDLRPYCAGRLPPAITVSRASPGPRPFASSPQGST